MKLHLAEEFYCIAGAYVILYMGAKVLKSFEKVKQKQILALCP